MPPNWPTESQQGWLAGHLVVQVEQVVVVLGSCKFRAAGDGLACVCVGDAEHVVKLRSLQSPSWDDAVRKRDVDPAGAGRYNPG